MSANDLLFLPPDLPVPVDDGACAHLPGTAVPPIALLSTRARRVRLDQPAARFTVVYAFPKSGRPGVPSPPGLDAIPGARGCTPQSCAYRDHHQELRGLGAEVYGVSTQSHADQVEIADRLRLPYEVLSDADLELSRALRLPTFTWGSLTLLKRHTLILERGRIAHVFYPVFPPDADARRVLEWLRQRISNEDTGSRDRGRGPLV